MTETLDPTADEVDLQTAGRATSGTSQGAGRRADGPALAAQSAHQEGPRNRVRCRMPEHLGYERHDTAGRCSGDSRNGTRFKTVLTEVRPVEIDVPRDVDSSFHATDRP